MSITRHLLVLLAILAGAQNTVNAQLDSLIHHVESMPTGPDKAMAFRNLSVEIVESKPAEALSLAKKGFELGELLKNDTVIEQSLYAIGLAYDYLNKPDSAFLHYDQGIASARLRGDSNIVYNLIFAKGNTYFYQGLYPEAIGFYDETLKYWEYSNDLEKQSKALNNIGIIYRLLDEYDKAIEVYQRSIEIKTLLSDTLGLANSHANLGKAYYHSDNYDLSLKHAYLSLSLYNDIGSQYDVASLKSIIGATLIAQEKYAEAEVMLLEALPEMSKKFNLDYLALQLNLARIDRVKNNPAAAIDRLLPLYDAAVNSNRVNSQITFEEELAKCYAQLGNFERAHHHLNAYLELFKASATESRQRLAEEMQAKFETREKENTIRMQELQIEKSARQKQTLFLGVALALLTIMAMIVLVIFKIRSNKKLSIEKSKTERLLRDRETLLREIHHRVKNNLQVVSSLLSIQGREITDGKARQAVNESRNRVHSMALIHQFLYGEENLSSIDMPLYVAELSKRLFSAYSMDQDLVTLHIDVEKIMLDVDTAIPLGLIINELVTNALKYAFPANRKGNLWVSLKELDDVLTLQVRDDGVGVADASENSTAFGMKLLNAFRQKLEAEFEIFTDGGYRVDYLVHKYKTTPEVV